MRPEEDGPEARPAGAAEEPYDDLVELVDDRDDLAGQIAADAAQSPPAQAAPPKPPPRAPSAQRRRQLPSADDVGAIIIQGLLCVFLMGSLLWMALPIQVKSIAHLCGWEQIATWGVGRDPVIATDTGTAIADLVVGLIMDLFCVSFLRVLLSGRK